MATELISSEIMQIDLKNGNGRQRINLLCKRLEVDLSTIFRVTKFRVIKKKIGIRRQNDEFRSIQIFQRYAHSHCDMGKL